VFPFILATYSVGVVRPDQAAGRSRCDCERHICARRFLTRDPCARRVRDG
jgi:hypothetical protein